MPPDRRTALAAQTVVTGIDFVRVAEDQVHLEVYFLTDPLALDVPLASLAADRLRIHSAMLPDVPIVSMMWALDAAGGRNVLQLETAAPGGFADYLIHIDDARIDPFFNDVAFSFKANCDSPFDCEQPPHECPPEPEVDFPVDTLARDFWSLRKALLDFAAQRHPDWKDRLEADVGVMLAETMSHLGDEMAYHQDRIAREASLEGASQRRSLRRHARLVDYVVHDGLGATAWLDVRVKVSGSLVAGTDVWAESTTGTIEGGVFVPRRIFFEVGRGLFETLFGITYDLTPARNSLPAHVWDETETCLPAGATEVWIDGHHAADLSIGRLVLLQTDPLDPALPARRHLVRLASVIEETDPLGPALGTSGDVTRLSWEAAEAPPFELDLERLTVHGNLVPATAGRTHQTPFSIGPSSRPVPRAVERTGADGSVAFLFTLADIDGDGLVWHADTDGDPRTAAPEVRLTEAAWDGVTFVPGEAWTWRRSLVGELSSQPRDTHYTLDDGTWARVAGYQRLGGEVVHVDYQRGAGTSLRFGDGEFGRLPARGSGSPIDDTFFLASWRLGNGVEGNVPAGAITKWDRDDPSLAFLSAITNPLPATDGLEPESAEDVKRFAPDAFRALTYRAVRPEDYAEAAERLPWVQRAGGAFRWTGSWLSCFVTADPHDAAELAPARRAELAGWLDRFRQTGREVHVLSPRYADVDLEVTICVAPTSYPGDVAEAVLVALFGKRGPRPRPGFFHPDRFTFGTPLDRSELEAAIQGVPGVRAVEDIQIRRRGWFDWRAFADLAYRPGDDEVIRIENDPLQPERGTLRLFTEGGA